MRLRYRGTSLLVLGLLALALPAAAFAGNERGAKSDDMRLLGDLNAEKPFPVVDADVASSFLSRLARTTASLTPPLETVRWWLGLDETVGSFGFKQFRLKAVSANAEVWVALNLNFPGSDCRNGERTTVTAEQIAYMLGEWEDKILPTESEHFSVAPPRNGAGGTLRSAARGIGPNYYAGDGNRTVILVDNIRDASFFDPNNSQNHPFVGGFVSSQLNNLFDRNVFTIDGYDWKHRTGENPPNEPLPGNNCLNAPARPFNYEGVFAHEYQHLLESYESPGEKTWVNEGLSDYAIDLAGYGDPSVPITEIGFDSHVQCFLGWLGVQTAANPNPRAASGPENSLTLWGDQGAGEILCDYGAAYTFMEYLLAQYGPTFLTALHRQDLNGLPGLQAVLDQFVTGKTAQEIIHDWAATIALDKALEGAKLRGGGSEAAFLAGLGADVRWDTSEAYSTPGAPPNGSDYVRLRDASGAYVGAKGLESIEFKGAKTAFKPLQWTVANDSPFQAGDAALYSGSANNYDEAMIRRVTVPTGAALTFDALYNLENTWDFAFVQISTNGGQSWSSLTCTNTRTTAAPQARATIVAQLPGFSGYSGGWLAQTCSLAAYAGQTVLLSFRVMTDQNTLGVTGAPIPAGVWIDDVAVGGSAVSSGSDADAWQSRTQLTPVSVNGYTVQLLAIDAEKGKKVALGTLPLNADFQGSLSGGELNKLLGNKADVVAALVMYDEPTETVPHYARYELEVNGVAQPGG